MKTIVLISCSSRKLTHKAQAKDLYTSPLFRENLLFANTFCPSHVFILSANYGLLKLDRWIAPYNVTLNEMKTLQVKVWAEKVVRQLNKVSNLSQDRFILLAGKRYRKFLVPYLSNYDVPLENMPIGKQLQYLKSQTADCPDNICQKLHTLFNNLPHYAFPFNRDKIPKNGIYVLFQKGERAHGTKRVVRIGTHTGNNQLPSRLNQHFLKENKDRSIFRKNIGRAILNRDGDPFLDQWELDLTPSSSRAKFKNQIDTDKLASTEKRVSRYIRRYFSFVIFPVENKDDRLNIESRLISTTSRCASCGPSRNWLGKYSPKTKIKKSGLWLVNELFKTPMSLDEYNGLKKLIRLNPASHYN